MNILRKSRSRAERPENFDANRAPVRRVLKILNNIELLCGESFTFLDDVCLAGDYRHVAAALARLTAAARQVGLELNPSKCEVVTCGGADSVVDMRAFPPGVKVNPAGAFSFLGARLPTVKPTQCRSVWKRPSP